MFKLAEHEWKQDVESKPKLRLHKTFKTNLKPANHLQSYMPGYKRSLLSQFRTGVLPLLIETSRYHLIKYSQTKNIENLTLKKEHASYVIQNQWRMKFTFFVNVVYLRSQGKKMFNEICLKVKKIASLTDEEKFQIVLRDFENLLIDYLKTSWYIRQSIVNR